MGHPSAVKWTVARAGQRGFLHRTEINKELYHVGKVSHISHKACTNDDMTEKDITSLGGFPHYGIIREDYVIIKGSVPGMVRRCITLRHSLFQKTSQHAIEQINL